MTQPCWNNLYFHNSFTYNFYFGVKGEGKEDSGRVLGALGHQKKCFYFYFLELVNMFVLHGSLIVGLN